MTEDQIKYMVDRFLGWKLPSNFNPDAGIRYTRPNYHPSVDATPSGTNLFDAAQADAMVRYMAEGMPTATKDAGGPFPNTAPIGYSPDYPVGSRPNIGDCRNARDAVEQTVNAGGKDGD